MQAKASIEQLADRIIHKTQQLCAFGSTNKKDLKGKAHNEFKKILRAIHFILNYEKYPTINAKLTSEEKKEINRLQPKVTIILAKAFGLTGKELKNSGYFSYLSLQDILSSKLLSIIAKLYSKTFQWNTDLLAQLHASFASYYRQTCDFANIKKLEREKSDNIKYTTIEELGCSQGDWEERAFYLNYILRAGRELVAEHGFANCDPLADIALFEAFLLKAPYPIARVNFVKLIKNPKGQWEHDPSDEGLNAIVLGDWPSPGCLIVCPWQNRYFYWQGFKQTPELPSHVNHTHVIFSDYENPRERTKITQLLAENNYSNWENLEQRQKNLQFIRELVEHFSKALSLANFPIATINPIATIKTTLHDFYKSQSFWAIPSNQKLVDLMLEYVGDESNVLRN